jgi:hypothetical protein
MTHEWRADSRAAAGRYLLADPRPGCAAGWICRAVGGGEDVDLPGEPVQSPPVIPVGPETRRALGMALSDALDLVGCHP